MKQPQRAAPEASPPPRGRYLLAVLVQKWKILGFVAACLLVTYFVCSGFTPVYEATVRLDLDRERSQVFGQGGSAVSSLANDADRFLSTQQELIQSDAVLRPVAQRFNLLDREHQLQNLTAHDALEKKNAPVFLKQLRVTHPVNTYLLRISYRSADPRLAADVANAIAESYLEHTFEIRARSSNAFSTFMKRQLNELKAKMDRSTMALTGFGPEPNVINPEKKASILSTRLPQLNADYRKAQAERIEKQAAYNALQNGAPASDQTPALSKASEHLNQAKQHFADVSTTYSANHSEYRQAANDLAEAQQQFEQAKRGEAQRIETEYREAISREQTLKRAVAQAQAEYEQLNSRSFEYQQVKREADADKALYADLEARVREAEANAGFENSAVRIADLARPPDIPVFPRKGLILLWALLISSVLGISGAILLDILDSTVRDPEQAAQALNVSVIGTLPAVKEIDSALLPVNGNGNGPATGVSLVRRMNGNSQPRLGTPNASVYAGISSYEESIRTLRNSILLPDLDRSVRSLMLASATPGEGKSTATIHLAIAHASQGKTVLIIDADLRRPAIHKKLGLDGSLGLSNVLLGQLNWREAVLGPEQWPDLDVIPAGTASQRASDLISSRIADILDEATEEYDLILVDSPPLLGFAEAMQVATAVDGVVVVARAGRTNRKAIARAVTTLHRLRANVLGLVLNEVDKNNGNDYYYADYRKYYAGAENDI